MAERKTQPVRRRSSDDEIGTDSPPIRLEEDKEFNENFRKAQEAIINGIYPELITEGSSGSYFVHDRDGKFLAVFKPKDEEPFAPLNPKWPKFFQRILCFCCFGRACLIPNAGYLSETGASVVDGKLGLNVVPKTRVVKLTSPSFFYERRWCGAIQGNPRPKEGSYQLFVEGYESAEKVLARWEYDPSLLSAEDKTKFIVQFQKMCVLDYIIRNTDRHMDNWLIRHVPGHEMKIAAIDNGLAFPVKHPEVVSVIRRFPFRWAQLTFATEPWDETLRRHLLSTITPMFVHELCKEIKSIFRYDMAASRILVYNQLRVLRGQLWNLREALERSICPADMAKMEPLIVKRRYRKTFPSDRSNWNAFFAVKPALQSKPCSCLACCCCCC